MLIPGNSVSAERVDAGETGVGQPNPKWTASLPHNRPDDRQPGWNVSETPFMQYR